MFARTNKINISTDQKYIELRFMSMAEKDTFPVNPNSKKNPWLTVKTVSEKQNRDMKL